MDNLTLILGGARSGKSSFAEQLAAKLGGSVSYIATAQALDQEMHARIKQHKSNRPSNWKTMEIATDIANKLGENIYHSNVILLDCITLLVSNHIMRSSSDINQPNEIEAKKSVSEEIESLITTIQGRSSHWIIVSNEVGMGLVPPYPSGRLYRDLLGWANQQLAEAADHVYFMVSGIPWKIKPQQFKYTK